jgi:mandelate racemase
MSLHESDKITELKIRPVCVPIKHPHKTAGGVITESPLVLCDIKTESGGVGRSIIFTYTRAALKPTAALLKGFEPLILGRELAPDNIEQDLAKRFRLLGPQGLVGMALAAIDMALWDALANFREKSLLALLGGTEKPIRAYGGIGYDGVKGSAVEAARWAKQGFLGVKAKIGYPDIKKDIAVIRAIRSEVGDDIVIMVDYNQCLTPTEAIERLRELEGEGLTWVEEPTLAHDYAGHAHIAREINTPIQCGENWWGTLDMQHAIDAKASDYMMPDVMKIGGVSGWMRAAKLAQAHEIPISSHLWPELSMQLLCLTPTAHWLEYIDWWNPIIENPLQIKDGLTTTQGMAGSGVQWNENAINRYSV